MKGNVNDVALHAFSHEPRYACSFFFGARSTWLALFHAASIPASPANVLRIIAENSRTASIN